MPTLLVFLKFPTPGRVKTRLAQSVGSLMAADLYRGWIDEVFAKVQPFREQVRVVACFTGAPLASFNQWSSLADEWWEQPEGDLGNRLTAAFESVSSPAIAIGTDCLDLDAGVLRDALVQLESYDAVLGPTADGGYYLVGIARRLAGFFEGIPWSSRETLSSQVTQCERNDWTFSLLPVRQDIDTLEDWQRHCEKVS